ncbi:MAG: CerR family C-terminal domain-containing protein [Planctomycetota bacterium]
MQAEDQEVKYRLIQAAMRLFADRGPHAVSIRQIAAEAGVTHGSIRYHFGTKEKLYMEVVNRLGTLDESLPEKPTPADVGALSREQAEQRFRSVVHHFVRFQARVGEDSVAALGFLHAEVSRDGGPDPVFYRRVIKPGHEHMKSIIGRIRPDIRDDETLEILAFNVIFQCVMVRIGQGIIKKLLGQRRLNDESVSRISELIAEVSLAGLREVEL